MTRNRRVNRRLHRIGNLMALGVIVSALVGSPVRAQPGQDPEARQSLGKDTAAAASSSVTTGSPAADDERPWARGVSREDQKKALELYELGNRYLAETLFESAAARYREALEYWNHPGIHYNLMLVQVNLGNPVEAYRSSLAALRHGPDALLPEEHDRARKYQVMLRQRIAELRVVCNEPGAIVTLDGKAFFVAPGRPTRLVVPGTYVLEARKPGYATWSQTITLVPGGTTPVELNMALAASGTRRWSPWKPWTGVGVAAAMSIVGVVMHDRANDTHRLYDATVRDSCTSGCGASEVPPGLPELAARGRRQRVLSGVAFTASAAIMATSLYFVYLNRPRIRARDHREKRTPSRSLVATPVIEPGGVGVRVRLSF